MDTMQQELGDQAALLGVNAIGYEDYNDTYTAGADLPWLQDTMSESAWATWGAEWRDVWILDTQGRLYAMYNLNRSDLGYEDDYEAMKALILEAGAR
jgi:hypothetical protein